MINNNIKKCLHFDVSLDGLASLLLKIQKNKDRTLPDQHKRKSSKKVGAWFLSGVDVGLAWLGRYAMVSGSLSLLPFLSNPFILIISMLSAIFPALIVAGLDTRASKKVLGITLLKPNEKEKRLKQRISLTQKLYNALYYQMNTRSMPVEAISYFQKIVAKNNALITCEYEQLYVAKPERKLHKSGRWGFLAINSLVQFAGGLILGKYLIGIVGLAFLPPPISISIAAIGGVFALSAFIIFKRRSVFAIFNSFLGKANPLSKKMTDYIYADNGINQMEKTLAKIKRKHKKQSYIYVKNKLISFRNTINKKDGVPSQLSHINLQTKNIGSTHFAYLNNNKFNISNKKTINDVENEHPLINLTRTRI